MAAVVEAHELEREWRASVDKDIRDLVTSTQTLAAAVSGLQEVAKAHQDRLAKLEGTPASLRGWINVALAAGGCLGMAVAALLSVASIAAMFIIYGHH